MYGNAESMVFLYLNAQDVSRCIIVHLDVLSKNYLSFTFLSSPIPILFFCCYWRGGFSRVSVIRGGVALQDGSPLVGVNITFPQHPEYGYSISRKDGR